ncbi:hypothetical protein PS631_02124 [Pseudomonas fluorescens]|uniref:Uncharacterized protein n=1 Tax=Pseudomonas fluorescens TaxID=294 RepID=A0A5E6S8M3_PSEFL|nr:dimethylsulfonioproprionate lyase family protein [Pseudomonas fluorescens]VVM77057.1 hypothetical protein PS631_02124 [Pseudomonas fluorescens]
MDLKFELTCLLKLIDIHLRKAAPNIAQKIQLNTARLNIKTLTESRLENQNFWAAKAAIGSARKQLASVPENIRLMASCISVVAHELDWYKKPNTVDNPEFHEGHFNAIIFGTRGRATCEDFMLGITVMQPQIVYPKHRHKPEELYIALSESEWWRPSQNWFAPGVGGTVHNPSNSLHSMRSVGTPLLALWLMYGDPDFVPGAV